MEAGSSNAALSCLSQSQLSCSLNGRSTLKIRKAAYMQIMIKSPKGPPFFLLCVYDIAYTCLCVCVYTYIHIYMYVYICVEAIINAGYLSQLFSILFLFKNSSVSH